METIEQVVARERAELLADDPDPKFVAAFLNRETWKPDDGFGSVECALIRQAQGLEGSMALRAYLENKYIDTGLLFG